MRKNRCFIPGSSDILLSSLFDLFDAISLYCPYTFSYSLLTIPSQSIERPFTDSQFKPQMAAPSWQQNFFCVSAISLWSAGISAGRHWTGACLLSSLSTDYTFFFSCPQSSHNTTHPSNHVILYTPDIFLFFLYIYICTCTSISVNKSRFFFWCMCEAECGWGTWDDGKKNPAAIVPPIRAVTGQWFTCWCSIGVGR